MQIQECFQVPNILVLGGISPFHFDGYHFAGCFNDRIDFGSGRGAPCRELKGPPVVLAAVEQLDHDKLLEQMPGIQLNE